MAGIGCIIDDGEGKYIYGDAPTVYSSWLLLSFSSCTCAKYWSNRSFTTSSLEFHTTNVAMDAFSISSIQIETSYL